MKEFLVE